MFEQQPSPSWAVRAAKLLSPGRQNLVLIRFGDDLESVEIVHASNVKARALLEAAQMAIVRVLSVLP